MLDKARKHADRLLKVNTRNIGWHGNAILVKRHIGVLDCAALDLPTLEPRGAVIAELLIGDKPLRVVGMHLDLSGLWRRRQMRAILDAIARRPQKMPTVLMGDTNEWRTEAGCLQRSRAASSTSRPTGPSFHARHPVAPLDRIIVHKDLSIEAAGVHMSPAARRASDHLPIWARVSRLAGDLPHPPALDRRADPHRLAIFDDGAAGDSRSLAASAVPAIASSLRISVSASISSLIAAFTASAAAPSPSADCNARAEEIFQLEQAAVAQQIFVRGHAADRRFVHPDRFGDFAQGHRLHRRHAALEEALLPLHDLGHDLDDRPRALVERLHQPVGALQAFAQPGPRRLVLRPGLELLIIAAVDQQPRQRRLVELDRDSRRASGGRTRRA